jgi:hypothetical protein
MAVVPVLAEMVRGAMRRVQGAAGGGAEEAGGAVEGHRTCCGWGPFRRHSLVLYVMMTCEE